MPADSQDFGRRLLPTVLHQEANVHPDHIFAVYAKSESLDDELVEVTFRQMARAVNYLANWIEGKFKDNMRLHETIAYLGAPDLRYNILFYAAIQCRLKILLPSPRNPTASNVSLLEQTDCVKVVYATEVAPAVRELEKTAPALKLQCEELPSLHQLVNLSTPSEYPYNFQFDDVCNDPVLVLHSSGSTGLPKPVVSTHAALATFDFRDIPTVPGRKNHDGLTTFRFPGDRFYDAFPPFHLAGFMCKILGPVFNLTAPIFGPPLRPSSGAMVAEIIRRQKPRGVHLPPSIVEQLYHEPGGIDMLHRLDVVSFAGGPLSSTVGDEVAKYTQLCQIYGSTEIGQLRMLLPSAEDWAYFEFHPIETLEMQPAGNGLSELVVFSDASQSRTSQFYHNYPGMREWRTKDLFMPHADPQKRNLWKYHARKDDILVLSSGEKLNPIPVESHLTSTEGILGALVVGARRPQVALLLELSPNAQSSSTPLQDLWPAIDSGNALLPSHGRIAKSKVIFATEPFIRAGKSTIMRAKTEDLYHGQIDQLYETSDKEGPPAANGFELESFDQADVQDLVRTILGAVSMNKDMDGHANFYAYGMDSLKTVEVVGRLRASLRPHVSSLRWLSPEVVYRSPTVEHLTQTLVGYLKNGTAPKRNREAEIEAAIKTYAADLHFRPASQSDGPPLTNGHSGKYSVAITGTTGYFGSYFLNELSKNPNVTQIYCLNRSPKAKENFESKFPGCANTEKIKYVRVKMQLPDLGISKEQYQIMQRCNAIIHNAWRVDFNITLSSFDENLQSITHLLNLSLSSAAPSRPRVFFVSSIAATGVFAPAGSSQKTVPEDFVDETTGIMDTGYAESKYVAERLLHAAINSAPVTVLRMGQISPSLDLQDNDTWPNGDVVPVYLRTCQALGAVASDYVDVMDWVSVDWAASVVDEIVRADVYSDEERVYNIVHPHPKSWSTVVETVRAWCGEQTHIVTMKEWVRRLREAYDEHPETLERLPALRMLPIYETFANRGPTHSYAMESITAASESMARLPAPNKESVEIWLGRL